MKKIIVVCIVAFITVMPAFTESKVAEAKAEQLTTEPGEPGDFNKDLFCLFRGRICRKTVIEIPD